MSLKPKIPTSLPLSTISAAFLASDITTAVSRRLVPGDTIVDGLPASNVRSVGDALLPKACAIKGPNNWVSIAAC